MSDPIYKDIPANLLPNISKIKKPKPTPKCRSCRNSSSETPLMQCVACKETRINSVYYCNRECQEKDWSRHKLECCVEELSGSEGFRKIQKAFATDLRLWTEVYHYALAWVVRQAFRQNSIIDPEFTILKIDLQRLYSEQTGFFMPTSLQFVPWIPFQVHHLNPNKVYNRPPEHYTIAVGGKPIWMTVDIPMTETSLEKLDKIAEFYEYRVGVCPEWPWVFTHICLSGALHRMAVFEKVVLYTQQVQRVREKIDLSTFAAGAPTKTRMWKLDRLRPWILKMDKLPWPTLKLVRTDEEEAEVRRQHRQDWFNR